MAHRLQFNKSNEGENAFTSLTEEIMKKLFATLMMMAMLAIAIPTAVSAQTYYPYKRPNIYQRHRNIINVGIGTAAGAILGGIFGGKKGAAIGALGGAGGGALYTYKIRPKRTYYRGY